MSGSLANRLVQAAAVALNAGSDQQAMLRHGEDARNVTRAVLRKLKRPFLEALEQEHARAARLLAAGDSAAVPLARFDVYYDLLNLLSDTADSIEKGE